MVQILTLTFPIIIIQLEARFQPNIEFTLEHALTVFTRSDITSPNGWNM